MPSKKSRRAVVRLTLIFCAGWVSYILYQDTDTQTHVAGLYSLCGLAGGIVLWYIHGSSQDAASYNDTLAKIAESQQR